MRQIFLFATRVNHQHKLVIGPPRNDQIIDHTTLLIGQQRIGLLMMTQSHQIGWH